MAKMMMFVCQSCGEEIWTDNEDDYVARNCPFCCPYDQGDMFDFDIVDTRDYRTCNCEDYPCCGH